MGCPFGGIFAAGALACGTPVVQHLCFLSIILSPKQQHQRLAQHSHLPPRLPHRHQALSPGHCCPHPHPHQSPPLPLLPPLLHRHRAHHPPPQRRASAQGLHRHNHRHTHTRPAKQPHHMTPSPAAVGCACVHTPAMASLATAPSMTMDTGDLPKAFTADTLASGNASSSRRASKCPSCVAQSATRETRTLYGGMEGWHSHGNVHTRTQRRVATGVLEHLCAACDQQPDNFRVPIRSSCKAAGVAHQGDHHTRAAQCHAPLCSAVLPEGSAAFTSTTGSMVFSISVTSSSSP